VRVGLGLALISCLLAGGLGGEVASAPEASEWSQASEATSSQKPGKIKTVSGKLRRIDGNVLTIVKRGLMDDSFLEVEMDDSTKKTGQVVQGMHVKVKYREVRDPEDKDNVRRIAVEIEARPEFASKDAKKAAKQTQPQ